MINPTIPETSTPTSDLLRVLQQMASDVVHGLGCVAALTTTVEANNELRVRAIVFDQPYAYRQNGRFPISTDDVVPLDNKQPLLGIQPGQPSNGAMPYHLSDDLFDLLRPLLSKRQAHAIQAELGVAQGIAIPFMLRSETVGSLIAIKQTPFSQHEIDILLAFGSQAAATIQSQRRLKAMEMLERIILTLQAKMTDEREVLQTVVDTVVQGLGYVGAMVATLETGNTLPVRAFALDTMPKILTLLEARAGLKINSPSSVVYLDDERYKDNLSVRAVRGLNGHPQNFVTSDSLYDLLRPFVDKKLAKLAQRLLDINQVIAVPFYLEDEVVGNLFVASRKNTFSDWEVSILTAFGQQAAAGIHNARLYRETEHQRQIAQVFGRMAFSATAAVHALGNHLSAVHTYLQMLSTFGDYHEEQQTFMLSNSPAMLSRLEKAGKLLDHLHEPWRQIADRPVQVNDALNVAIREVFPDILQEVQSDTLLASDNVSLHIDLQYDLPPITASPDMLAEAFRVLIKNAREALGAETSQRQIWISSRLLNNQIGIVIRDTGSGVPAENLPSIFKLGWSTKGDKGMGFGLFWTRDYVRGLNGRIEVESIINQGTTFKIYLPAPLQ